MPCSFIPLGYFGVKWHGRCCYNSCISQTKECRGLIDNINLAAVASKHDKI